MMASCTEEKIHAALFVPRSRQIVVEGLEIADCALPTRSTCLVSSIKVEVKKKHSSISGNFSCFAAHLIEQDLF
jgi:hypothetical protein